MLRYFANFQKKKKIINFNNFKNLVNLTQKSNFTNTACHDNKIITTKTENAKLRILGVAKSPKSLIPPKKLGLSERFSNIFSAEKNKEKREELLKEYKTSYWKDFNELRTNGEKLWEADTELVNAEKALYMPNIKARTLNKPIIDTTDLLEGNVSLVSIVFNQFGENHTQTFINPFLQEFFNHDKIQLVQINIEMNFVKSLLLRLLIPYIKRTIPVSQHSKYIIIFNNHGNLLDLKEALQLNNIYRGYVFLVDSNCKIRWTSHGNATSQEIESMLKLTRTLNNIK
ncbi:hypothetical protein Glove_284g110 [Diversispora epigaea]|uniref:Uncharacterized protein n=1 Tax=Diversispora epigaea TaxID=1348612 RepID=A0A397I1E5_9GLOM|nr:hypothetical protein Glove_284g110 [Diversispora epigaea]